MRQIIQSILFAILLTAFVFVLSPSATIASSLFTNNHLSVHHNLPNACLKFIGDSFITDSIRNATNTFPTLAEFASSLGYTDPGTIIGVYVCRVLALRVIQQPQDDPVYVSTEWETATQFRLASDYGTLGLLAHNDRAGARFFDLMIGHEVDVVYGDGAIRRYVVSSVRHFQPVESDNPYSSFYDLDYSSDPVSSTQVFQHFFASGDQVVFQTCISANGSPTWGRLFVIATPISLN